MNIVVVAALPWGFLWQRPQQIASGLAIKGHRVIYFQNPTYLKTSIKINNSFLTREAMQNLYVANLFPPPFFGKLRVVTEKLGFLLFKTYLRWLSIKPDVVIIYSLMYDFLLGPMKSMGLRILYDCIDDHSAFSGTSDVSKVLKAEERIVKESAVVTATSRNLCERLSKTNPNCHYVPNAVDFDHFHKATRITEKPKDMQHLKPPIIGFIGAIYDWIDIGLICKLAQTHPDYSIIIVGPIEYGQERLRKQQNITTVGAKPYSLLPHYLAHVDVCLIPFKINRLTLAANPIKLYEYLAAGKPVVSTPLPEVRDNASHVAMIADDADDFIRKVETAANETKNPKDRGLIQERINFAKNNSWKARVDTIEKLLEHSANLPSHHMT